MTSTTSGSDSGEHGSVETRYVCPHGFTATQTCYECDESDNMYPHGWRHLPVDHPLIVQVTANGGPT